MIDIRKLKELVRLMVDNDLVEIDLRDGEEQVTVRRPDPSSSPVMVAPPAGVHAAPQPAPAPANTASQTAAAPADGGSSNGRAAGEGADQSLEGLIVVESPMVGTFYAASSPDAEPFVKVGQTVRNDSVVCLIEAMKIFNEIKAEAAGTVHTICVENGAPVEFGEPLFYLQPA